MTNSVKKTHENTVLDNIVQIKSSDFVLKKKAKQEDALQSNNDLMSQLTQVAKKDDAISKSQQVSKQQVQKSRGSRRNKFKNSMVGLGVKLTGEDALTDSGFTAREQVLPKKSSGDVVEQQKMPVRVEKTTSSRDEVEKNSDLKSVGKGLVYMYISKTNAILTPIQFVTQNLVKIISALTLLGVPALLVMYMMGFSVVSEKVISGTPAIYNFKIAILYLATLFIWFTSLFLASMFVGMCKREIKEIAKIGKEVE